MYTQSAPSLMNALSGYLPDAAVRAVVQALGNCQQPLAHRGEVVAKQQRQAQPHAKGMASRKDILSAAVNRGSC